VADGDKIIFIMRAMCVRVRDRVRVRLYAPHVYVICRVCMCVTYVCAVSYFKYDIHMTYLSKKTYVTCMSHIHTSRVTFFLFFFTCDELRATYMG